MQARSRVSIQGCEDFHLSLDPHNILSRHEKPQQNELSHQNIQDRYYGHKDPVACNILSNFTAKQGLTPPEDTSIICEVLCLLLPILIASHRQLSSYHHFLLLLLSHHDDQSIGLCCIYCFDAMYSFLYLSHSFLPACIRQPSNKVLLSSFLTVTCAFG